jgi:hypothetical protein
MKKWRFEFLAVLVGAALFVFLHSVRQTPSVHATATVAPDATASKGSPNQRAHASQGVVVPSLPKEQEQPILSDATSATTPAAHFAPVVTPPVPETAESSSLPPATILQNMRTTIVQYGSTFGENPVGNNAEITKALQGDNPKQINFLKDDGNRVNVKGELVDAWGTPYFFHQISGHEMEIRSAGPDRVMYTKDDLVTR